MTAFAGGLPHPVSAGTYIFTIIISILYFQRLLVFSGEQLAPSMSYGTSPAITGESHVRAQLCSRCHLKHFVFRTMAQAKRLIMIVIGFTVLLVGIAMVVLPGPAVIVIPVGLAILATEFLWARKLLDLLKARIQRLKKVNRKSG
jgi:tellurite resistance protein TerC